MKVIAAREELRLGNVEQKGKKTNSFYISPIIIVFPFIDLQSKFNLIFFFMFPVSGAVYRFNNVSRGQGSFIHWNSVAW